MGKNTLGKAAALFFCAALTLAGCSAQAAPGSESQSTLEKYQAGFYDVFDTYTTVTGYAETEEAFEAHADGIEAEMQELHELYDIYNDYPGLHNIKTINDNAGLAPVEVDPRIMDLLQFGIETHEATGGRVNIAMGVVLRIWHEYRDAGLENPDTAALPPMDALEEAAAHCNIEDVILDEEANTVFLRDPEMSLDVGALAKGYAVQRAADTARAAGFTSGIISAGGNVCAVGAPAEIGKETWSVGVQNPEPGEEAGIIDTVSVNDMSMVTSGGYQRYYTVEGRAYHHLIDPETGMPAATFQSVSVLHGDSATAEMLSTALFLLSFEEGAGLLETYGGEAIWIFADGAIEASEGYRAVSGYFARQGGAG